MIKNPYLIAAITNDNKIGFYDGTGFDTIRNNAKLMGNLTAKKLAIKFNKLKGIKNSIAYYDGYTTTTIKNDIKKTIIKKKRVVKKKRIVKKRNPIANSKKRRVKRASNLYKDFTGHDADNYKIVKIPDYDVGLKVGKCCGIMYETIRDGKKEKYLHEFRKTSQPDLAVSHDGQQIFLIGGSYLFKDSGINDT